MFTPNNIKFRIVSSTSIANFKRAQAFDFNEIASTDRFEFSQESKEILLLHYDLWFKFILKLEKKFIRLGNNKTVNELMPLIMISLDDTLEDIDDVITSHPIIFASDVKDIVKKTHSIYIDYIARTIKNVGSQNIFAAFPKIVDAIEKSLGNLLFQLHEIEQLENPETSPFLSYSDECNNVWECLNRCPLIHRAKIYEKKFGIKKFYIKNYSESGVTNVCLAFLTDNDIEIEGIIDAVE